MISELFLLKGISRETNSKIILVVIDGLGGLRHPDFGNQSELQYANLPNLDEFVKDDRTVTGLIYPVRRGLIPGSVGGHLGLFGFDPLEFRVGRGAIEAEDLVGRPGVDIQNEDVLARLNFCTVDEEDVITDRRAGRIQNGDKYAELLNQKIGEVMGTPVRVIATKEHRGVLIIKNPAGRLHWNVHDTDPQFDRHRVQPAVPMEENEACRRTAQIVNEFCKRARDVLRDQYPVNYLLLRGFSSRRSVLSLPSFREYYKLNACAIATYPLYRGLAHLLGMTVIDGATDLKGQVRLLLENYQHYDFFFLHYKDPDSRGEDGDFQGKVRALEAFDQVFPQIMDLGADVLVVTGDHSTPSAMKKHTEHSVPLAIRSKYMKGFDRSQHFDEDDCNSGTFGRIEGAQLMKTLLAKAGKLAKWDG